MTRHWKHIDFIDTQMRLRKRRFFRVGSLKKPKANALHVNSRGKETSCTSKVCQAPC